MTTSASQLIHEYIGSPQRADCAWVDESHLCWLCAAPARRGQLVGKWQGANFTGQTRVRCPASPWVCEACVYVCARLSPVPGRPPQAGKKHGGNWRNYSHLYDADEYTNASKGEKPAILAFLLSPHKGPWFATIADSGQKHMLPQAPVNPRGARRGLVLFEEAVVQVPSCDAAAWAIVERMAELLTAGATKDEIATARYTARAWRLCGERALRVYETSWGQVYRGGAWHDLALWLAQRDEEQVAARQAAEKEEKQRARRRGKGATTRRNRGTIAGVAGSVSGDRGQRAETLGRAAKPNGERIAEGSDTGGMGNNDGAGPAAASPGQGCLPGIA